MSQSESYLDWWHRDGGGIPRRHLPGKGKKNVLSLTGPRHLVQAHCWLTAYGPGLNHFCTEPLASPVTMDKCSHHRSPQLHPNVMRKTNWTPTLKFYVTYGTLSSNKDYAKSKEKKVPVITGLWQMTLRGIPHNTTLSHQMPPSLRDLSTLVLSELSQHTFPWPTHNCQHLAAITHLQPDPLLGRTLWPFPTELKVNAGAMSFSNDGWTARRVHLFRLALDRFTMPQPGSLFSLKKKKKVYLIHWGLKIFLHFGNRLSISQNWSLLK